MGGCISSKSENQTCIKCGKTASRETIPRPVLKTQTPPMPNPSPQLAIISSKAIPDQKTRIKIKVPIDKTNTKYEWKQQKALIYPPQIKNIPAQGIKNATFQEKLAWFRYNLESKRISWEKGSQVLKVDRWNILFSSLNGLRDKNLYKELKIQFTDQKVDDAGGLLRQWMHLCIKQIMSKQTGIFKSCNTTQTAYHLVWDKTIVQQIAIESLNLLGTIIGKALFQRISLNCYLDYTILRQLCSQSVHLSDVYSYDKDLYKSWAQMLVMADVRELELDGCVYKNHGENDLEVIQLFPNGKNTLISNQTRDMYVKQIIHLYCTKSIQPYLKTLFMAVYKIVPKQLLSIFAPYQLQMVLNGPRHIDVVDWRTYTIYQGGYSKDDEIIRWFWEQVGNCNQEDLRNLLHYCTGGVKVPILGFRYLQSNRGEVRPFTIRKVEYSKQNPFPKSFTCFNRLQLPFYKDKQQLKSKLKVIMSSQFNHFGLG